MPDGEVLGPTEQAVGAAAAAARRGRGGGGPQDVVRSGGVEQTVDEPAPDVAESVGRHAVGVRRDQDDAAVRLDLVQRLEPHLQLRDHSTHFITNTNLYDLITEDGVCTTEFRTRSNKGQAIGTSLQNIEKKSQRTDFNKDTTNESASVACSNIRL